MAAATEAFVNAVEGALANAEVDMVNNRTDEEKTWSTVQEVRSLLRPVAIRHFDTRRGFKAAGDGLDAASPATNVAQVLG